MNIHFISGLPRSGSTLLAAILRQNPRFLAGMTSPVASLYQAAEVVMSMGSEGAVFFTDAQRRAVLRGLVSSYYEDQAAPVIFDTNRMWAARMPAIAQLYPEAKVICCVRDVGWIMDSFERLHARNPFELSGINAFDAKGTVYSRCGRLASGDGPVGWSLNAMREALAGEQANRLLLVEYHHLCQNPEREISRIYSFIGEKPFAHDFGHVEYSASEFDRNIGARGLHEVNGAVRWKPRKTILPPDLFASYGRDQFWRAA
jgi:sulfotransferase